MLDLRQGRARERRPHPYLVAEMDHSYFVVGDHQFHQGLELRPERGREEALSMTVVTSLPAVALGE